MKANITWYKPSGKWYMDDTIEIPNVKYISDDALKQLIVDRQTQLADSWVETGYIVTIRGVYTDPLDHPSYLELPVEPFVDRLYNATAFSGMRTTKL